MPLSADDFQHQHAQLLALAARLAEMLSDDLVMNHKLVRHLIDTLAAHLRIHLEAEDEGIYPQLGRSIDPAVRDSAERFGRDMGGLRKTFERYAHTWSDTAIRLDTVGFTAATTAILEDLRYRIAQEDTHLYPLVRQLAITASNAGLVDPPAIARAKPLILVIDDNEGDFILLREAWKDTQSDVEVTYFPHAEAFLDGCEAGAVPDLFVIDINLPIVGGLELTRRLRSTEKFSAVPIVVCSSSTRISDSDEAMASGATGFFPKPATFPEYLPFVLTMNDLIAYHRNS